MRGATLVAHVASARLSRWARRFLVASVGFLVLAQVAALAGGSRRLLVVLGLQGFVLSAVFGKAYSLVPSYFDRTLAWPLAPAVHLPLSVLGVLGLAAATTGGVAPVVGAVGTLLWAAGVAVFLLALLATVRDNLTGAETGTSEAKAHRRRLDRAANAVVPVALAYLAAGTYELVATATAVPASPVALPALVGGGFVRATHLLAAGFALLLLFGVGFRLLPRFLVATPPERLAWVVLPAGALAPLLLVSGFYSGPVFVAGAALEALAVVGFAAAYLALFRRSDRRRVGFWGPTAGVLAGVAGVGLGLQFALAGLEAPLATSHWHLNVFGLLGLTILGLLYQFYPPGVGRWPGCTDRSALATIAVMAAGVALAAAGPLTAPVVGDAGHLLVGAAGLGAGYLLVATMRVQTGRGR